VVEDKFVCPHSGQPVHRRPYLMSADPDAPGFIGTATGERGEAWRRCLVVAVCLLAVLIWLAIRQLAS
jgi:hypothetical protein